MLDRMEMRHSARFIPKPADCFSWAGCKRAHSSPTEPGAGSVLLPRERALACLPLKAIAFPRKRDGEKERCFSLSPCGREFGVRGFECTNDSSGSVITRSTTFGPPDLPRPPISPWELLPHPVSATADADGSHGPIQPRSHQLRLMAGAEYWRKLIFPSALSTSTNAVIALGPCASFDVPLSKVRTFGFP
jgi:hypothetical protein